MNRCDCYVAVPPPVNGKPPAFVKLATLLAATPPEAKPLLF